MKLNKTTKWGIILSSLYLVLALYISVFRWSDVQGNLEASYLCSAPFVASHVLLHRKINKANN
jgi:hypothetical protein